MTHPHPTNAAGQKKQPTPNDLFFAAGVNRHSNHSRISCNLPFAAGGASRVSTRDVITITG